MSGVNGFLLASDFHKFIQSVRGNFPIHNENYCHEEMQRRIHEITSVNLAQENYLVSLDIAYYSVIIGICSPENMENMTNSALQMNMEMICRLSISGEFERAGSILKKIISIDPSAYLYSHISGPYLNSYENILGLCKLLIVMSSSGAGQAIRHIIDDISKRAIIIAYNIQSDLDKASVLCREIINLDPDKDDAHHLMSALMRRMNKFDSAATFNRRVIALCPAHIQAYYHLSVSLSFLKHLDASAGAAYRQIILHQNEKIFLHHIIALIGEKCLVDRRINSHIVEIATKAVILNPFDEEYWKILISILVKLFAYEKAIEITKNYLCVSPGDIWAMEIFGQLLNRNGNFAYSLIALEHAKSLGNISYSSQAFIMDNQRALNKPYRALHAAWVLSNRTLSKNNSITNPNNTDIDAVLDQIDQVIPKNIDKENTLIYIMDAGAIGHLAAEPSMLRSMFQEFAKIIIIFSDKSRTTHTNPEIFRLVGQYANFVCANDEKVIGLANLEVGTFWRGTTLYMLHSWRYVSQRFFNFLQSGGKRIPAYLLPDQLERGQRIRRKIGLPDDAKIVVMHLRHGNDENSRNATPELYFDGIKYLTDEGFFIVRIGNKKMKPLPCLGSQVFDLPFMDVYDHVMDPYFMHECNYMLTSLSGPIEIGRLFEKPAIMPNVQVTGTVIGDTTDYVGFRKYIDFSSGRPRNMNLSEILKFDEDMDSERRIIASNIKIEEISSCEIREIIMEAIEFYRQPMAADKLLHQDRFVEICTKIDINRKSDAKLVSNYADWCGYASGLVRISGATIRNYPEILDG